MTRDVINAERVVASVVRGCVAGSEAVTMETLARESGADAAGNGGGEAAGAVLSVAVLPWSPTWWQRLFSACSTVKFQSLTHVSKCQ